MVSSGGRLFTIEDTETTANRDKLRALELLGKTMGLFTNRIITAPEVPQLTEAERARLRAYAAQIDDLAEGINNVETTQFKPGQVDEPQ